MIISFIRKKMLIIMDGPLIDSISNFTTEFNVLGRHVVLT